jgi:hypothetical protein
VKETTEENMSEWIDYFADEGKVGKYIMTDGHVFFSSLLHHTIRHSTIHNTKQKLLHA